MIVFSDKERRQLGEAASIIVGFEFGYKQVIASVVLVVIDVGSKILFEYGVGVFGLLISFWVIGCRELRCGVYAIAQTFSEGGHKLSISIRNDGGWIVFFSPDMVNEDLHDGWNFQGVKRYELFLFRKSIHHYYNVLITAAHSAAL